MRCILLLLLLIPCVTTFSQEYDATTSSDDSLVEIDDSLSMTSDTTAADSTWTNASLTSEDQKAVDDSIPITRRAFDATTVDQLKKDPELQYQEVPTVGESLWSRFLAWLSQLIESFFEGATTTNWGKTITYIVVLGMLVVIILTVLKVNAFKVISGEGADTFRHNVLDEDIHAMDFDKLIQQAISANDHRLAVRLTFLYALKILSDKSLVHFDQGKTNHDYLGELKVDALKGGFYELNYYFEYAWYGNFRISPTMFAHVQSVFNDWKTKL